MPKGHCHSCGLGDPRRAQQDPGHTQGSRQGYWGAGGDGQYLSTKIGMASSTGSLSDEAGCGWITGFPLEEECIEVLL